MNYWIFQSMPDRFDLREEGLVEPGKKETWYATRYRGRMKVGDIVFFWLGGVGEKRGIYASGEIVSDPYRKDDWDSYGVDVRYLRKLLNPIEIQVIKNKRIFSDLLILRVPLGTNFSITEDQGKEFERMTQKEVF